MFFTGICLVEAESGRSTTKVTEYPNYKSYGLFQINSKEWCRSGKRGGDCNMRCEGKQTVFFIFL